MNRSQLHSFYSLSEVAMLLHVEEDLLLRLWGARIHPPYLWHSDWPEPWFPENSLREWRQILDTVEVTSLPEKIPPFVRPSEVFDIQIRRSSPKECTAPKPLPSRIWSWLRAAGEL